MLMILTQLKQTGYQLSDIAFLSPIEGNQYNSGLKRVANILDKNNIAYNAYYRETKESTKKNCFLTTRQAVNLYTIHGSKGLEFKVVILLHFSDNMMNSEMYEQ
jgi:superfamily I DNA/RNA helicase